MNNLNRLYYWVGLGIRLLLTPRSAPSLAPQRVQGDYPEQVVTQESASILLDDYGPAPEIENEVWLNTQGPLRLANLRGSVVLLEMWTFG